MWYQQGRAPQNHSETFEMKGWIGRGTFIHFPARSPDPTSRFVLCGTTDRQNL